MAAAEWRGWGIALALSCAVARAADVPDQLVSFGDIAERDVFLEVSINGANTSQLLRFRDAQGRLSASADALRSVGIGVPGPDGAAGSPELRLDAIPGLRYSYNAATQSVNLVVPDALRTPYALDMRGVSRAAGHQRTRAGAELRRLRADQRLVPVVAVHRTALFQSVRRVQQHRHQLSWRARQPCRWHWALHPLRHVLDAFRPGHDAHAAAGRHDHVVAGLVALDPHRRCRGPQLRCGQTW